MEKELMESPTILQHQGTVWQLEKILRAAIQAPDAVKAFAREQILPMYLQECREGVEEPNVSIVTQIRGEE